jgi:hypothetical protein
MKNYIVVSFTIVSLLISCKDSKKSESAGEKSSFEDVAKTLKLDELVDENTHRVIVKEKLAAGGYVYLKVLEKGNEYWMAVPGRQIEIGATYYYDGGMEMRNFESKTLKRTFDTVIFAEGVREKKDVVKKVKKVSIKKEGTSTVEVEKAPNGIRIAELFENPKGYQNKHVIIKGQVVKVNNGIMGVNFVHLQDGTKGKGEYDITITSNDEFKIGDVVTIKGTVILNKDFGAGYTYDVLIENAVILE